MAEKVRGLQRAIPVGDTVIGKTITVKDVDGRASFRTQDPQEA